MVPDVLQVPPPVGSVRGMPAPAHTLPAPTMPGGAAITVIAFVTVQPVPSEYVIVVEVPAVIPVTIPDSEPIVAAAVLPLVQTPPPTLSVNVAVPPAHTVEGPVMVTGELLTVTVIFVAQPVGKV